jgi:hypothetical protein
MIYSFILRFVFFCIYITYKCVPFAYNINHAMKYNMQIINDINNFGLLF